MPAYPSGVITKLPVMLAVVTSSATTNLQDIVSSVQSHGIPFDQVTLATNSACLERNVLVSGFDTILSVGEPGDHTVELLGVLSAALRPGGLLIVKKEGTLQVRAPWQQAAAAALARAVAKIQSRRQPPCGRCLLSRKAYEAGNSSLGAVPLQRGCNYAGRQLQHLRSHAPGP